MKTKILLPAIVAVLASGQPQAREAKLSSPDGSISVSLSDTNGFPAYTVSIDGRTIIEPSEARLDIKENAPATSITKISHSKGVKEHIVSPFYRQREFDAEYNSMTVKFNNGTAMEWRAFDDGVAYRHIASLKGDSIIVMDETVSLNFPGDPTMWLPYSTNDKKPMAMGFQNYYDETPLSHAKDKLAFLPVTADMGNNIKLTLLEANLESYPGMFVKADTVAGKLNGVHARYPSQFDYHPWRQQRYVADTHDYIARTAASRTFPWRVMAITRQDTQMPTNNLVYALASPSRVADTSWIKPGKVAWDWWNAWALEGVPFEAGINTETYKYYIDFAAANGLEYVVLDEGWYVPGSGDMLTVIDDIDLPELIAYGRDKGVSLVLWTVFNVLDSQLEDACRKYSDMGIKGFKVDFMDRDDQTAIEMTYRVADACARHKLFLDFHGIYKPTGLHRTYPNVLNFEGVFGLEEVKWTKKTTDFPRYDVTYPYIRMMAGQADYTPGAMNNASKRDWAAAYNHPASMGTRAHQVSLYIIQDSPFTMLCDTPTAYMREQETTDFIASLPVTFDETHVVDGTMGEYIVTVRRLGEDWYVGGATNWDERDITVDLSFLPAGKVYKAKIFADGINAAKSPRDYTLTTQDVTESTSIPLHLAPGGGFAIILKPSAD